MTGARGFRETLEMGRRDQRRSEVEGGGRSVGRVCGREGRGMKWMLSVGVEWVEVLRWRECGVWVLCVEWRWGCGVVVRRGA